MLTGLPAAATFWMKSVWRHRNAGVCNTSTTSATSSNGVYSCTSVSTGTPICFFTSPRMRRPSSIPSPRKLFDEVRLALSKLDLKMKGMPSRPVISLRRPAASSWSCSDSTTQGPAIRNKGSSRPTSKPHNFTSSPQPSSRRLFREQRCIAHGLVFARGLHETVEQRVAVARRRGEFRMELAGQEPRVFLLWQFHDLDQIVHRHPGDRQPCLLQPFAVAVVDLETMAVALADGVGAIQPARDRARLQQAFLRTEAHGAAEVGGFV